MDNSINLIVKRIYIIFFIITFTVNFRSFLFPVTSGINVAFDRILQDSVYASGEISSILQDEKGFIWFGTSDGLCRYDGYECVVFENDPAQPSSISHSNIICLYLDREGVFWIGTKDGLNRFNCKTETFERFYHDANDPESLSNSTIEVICEDSVGYLWIGTEKGLNRFDRATGKSKRFMSDKTKSDVSLSNDWITAICEDSFGDLWIGTENGLNQLNKKVGTFRSYFTAEKDPALNSKYSIKSLYDDGHGVLWIGTWGMGLRKFMIKSKRFTTFNIKDESNKITSLCKDMEENLWVGTRGSGLCRFLKDRGEFSCFKNDAYNPRSLSNDKVNTIYCDKAGILWIGTLGGGINTYNRRKEKFVHYYSKSGSPNGLSDNTVCAILEASGEVGEILWIGTYNGLNRYNRKTKKFAHIKHVNGDPTSISNNVIRCISEDRTGMLWVGTDNGLNRYDRTTGKFTSFYFDEHDRTSISGGVISSIYEDKKGTLWIGTIGRGLNRFKRVKQAFERFQCNNEDPDGISRDKVFCIHETYSTRGEQILWVGTYGNGLNKFLVNERRVLHYKANAEKPGCLSNDDIRVICQDRNGMLWMGTDGGLNSFDPEKETFTVYSVKDGLANNAVYGILEDDAGYLWLSTGNGLSRFDARQKVFRNFDASDGLMFRLFNHNSYYKSQKTGEMFLGSVNGFISFFPSSIRDNTNIPNILVTGFNIFNQPVSIGEKLANSITETTEIILTHDDYWFSFEFAALDFTSPEKNKYAYKMEGFDKKWNVVDAKNRTAPYMNLGAGKYTFRVKGSNNDNIWNEEGASIEVIIKPPFWMTLWFIGAALFVLSLLILAGYKWRTKLLRKKLAEQERVQKILQQSRDEMEKSRNLAEFRNAENEKLITAISSIFIAVDANGNIFQWNHSSQKFFGMSESEVKERSFVEILKDQINTERLDEIINQGLHLEKRATSIIEIPVRSGENDESRLLLVTINPIIDRIGRKFGFLLLAEDITNRKKEQMQQVLSQKLEALGQMAAGIAHEIRSPLQYIGDNGRFLQEAFDNLTHLCTRIDACVTNAEKSGDMIDARGIKAILAESDFEFFIREIPRASEQIVDGVGRVSNIVKFMNEFAHTENGVSVKSDLNEMLKTTLVVAQSRISKVADLKIELARDLPPVPCGMGELNQVFLNLLLNAADAIAETGRRGTIKVSTVRNGSDLIVRISDDGVGIQEKNKEKIFTPFFTTKDVGKGTGQGLHFSYRIIVERHKGKLYFDSQVGKGTTFFVHLPVLDNPGEV
jgi:PAS domain S-box-containing protein